MSANSYVPSSGRMYFCAIASTWPFTSRARARAWRSRPASSSASTKRWKLSSGNFASTGMSASFSRMTASTRSPLVNPYWRSNRPAGRMSERRFASSISPTPPRAFGGRRSCSKRWKSFVRSLICAVASSTLPRRSWIRADVSVMPARRRSTLTSISPRRRSTFVSSSPKRRSIVSVMPARRRSISAFRPVSCSALSSRRPREVARRTRTSQTAPRPAAAATTQEDGERSRTWADEQ